jgi:hypothetical protein
MSKLVVVFNGQSVIEYDRNRRLPGQQREYLDRMDDDMAAGIDLNGEPIMNPDSQQRAKFVAMQLVHAVINDNDPMIAAMSAYLAIRLPALQQVKAEEHGEHISLELVFTDSTTTQVPVTFSPTLPKSKTH